MNQQERDLISQFVARVGGAPNSGFGGSQTPATLPPVDPEADRWIAENFQKYPEARYRVTQMAVVQEVALAEAQNRIRQLEFQLQQAQSQLQQAQQQRPQGGGGLFGGLFGGGGNRQQQAGPPPGWGGQPQQGYGQGYGQGYAPPPQANLPPGYAPGMFQQRGTGFLGSALTTATGVAGGMLAANAIESLFSGHHGAGGIGSGETIINNNYGDGAGNDPFAGNGEDAGQNYDANDWGNGGGGDWGGDSGGGWGDDSF